MTKEEIQLLITDLAARLPYGVIVQCRVIDFDTEEYSHDKHPTHTRHPEYTGNGKLFLVDTLSNSISIRPCLKGLQYSEAVFFESMCNKGYIPIDDVRPYLRPMSSMTKEELKEYYIIVGIGTNPVVWNKPQPDWHFSLKGLDWLYQHHFDVRGLISMGLAIEAPKDMYK